MFFFLFVHRRGGHRAGAGGSIQKILRQVKTRPIRISTMCHIGVQRLPPVCSLRAESTCKFFFSFIVCDYTGCPSMY